MKRAILFWFCGALVLFFAGCATTRYEEFGPPPEGEATKLPLTLEAVLPLQEAMSALEARIARLEAELANRATELEAANSDLTARLMSLLEQMEEVRTQLQSLQEGEKARTVPEGADASAGERSASEVPDVSAWDMGRLYEQGLVAYNDRRYAEAGGMFQKVMDRDPQGELADNARYWIGECDYALGDYRKALESFQGIFSYSRTEKYDDAQLKLGLCHLQLGDRATAIIELKRLIVDYPESEYLRRAEELISKIRAEQETGP